MAQGTPENAEIRALSDARLEDRYDLERPRAFLTGTQALVRALLTQAALDRRAGHVTGGFVSGYRGSPLGTFDREMERANGPLDAAGIHFTPGVNEELAATAIWGSQQLRLAPGARFDGVFGLWYGKGPGVDRAGDAFKHANLAGTAPLGGALAVAGDDHAGVSSTTTHQSEFAFVDYQIPVLAPASVQEVLDYAVAGIALSRASGAWTALKCPSDIIERAESVDADPARHDFRMPEPPADLHIRWPDRLTDQEARLAGPKLDAARAFVRANGLDRITGAGEGASLGIVAAGKAWGDLRDGLALLGLDEKTLAARGIRLFKPAMVWPLVPETVRDFADGLADIVVIEEKRPLLEPQLRDILYDAPARPRITGKTGADRLDLAPTGVIDGHAVAAALAPRLGIDIRPEEEAAPLPKPALRRPAHFCSGCPHNTSTRVPEGSRALAGIGCHTLALWSQPNTETLTQMGGEGATWIGQAPFTDTEHVFANIGDGTYYHSGLLAIRAAISAGVTITYKLLYNDAVAMTGGQAVEGNLSVPAIARELAAEGVRRIVVVAEEPDRYANNDPFPKGTSVMGRDGFDCAQAELAQTEGVSVLIFDQACAAEKRRRRKRGTLEDPDRYVVINERVCEGCGDCQRASHCLSVVPVQTPLGDKRRVDLATCNKDETCVDGFCPAIVTIEGARPRKRRKDAAPDVPAHLRTLPAPPRPTLDEPWRILVAGIGGTGVVTVGHLIAMAAHLDGNAATVLDQTGLAQKGGAVASHVTLSRHTGAVGAARIGKEAADAVIGCDMVVAADRPQLATVRPGRTRVLVNTEEVITGAFLADPKRAFPAESLLGAIASRSGKEMLTPADARRLAERLTGQAITANVLLLGIAWQMGLVPVSEDALRHAMTLNGQGADTNQAAFLWGRRAARDIAAVRKAAGLDDGAPKAETLDDMVAVRAGHLAGYGGAALADRYRARVDALARRAAERAPGRDGLAAAVADGYFRVLAAKDEYEVARLFTDGVFAREIAKSFEGTDGKRPRIRYHLAPAWAARHDARNGRVHKRDFGPWLTPVLSLLAKCRPLRGGILDPFRSSADRALERRHRAEYEEDLDRITATLAPATFDLCVELARLPASVRGFGHVRAAAWEQSARRRDEIRAALESPAPGSIAAE